MGAEFIVLAFGFTSTAATVGIVVEAIALATVGIGLSFVATKLLTKEPDTPDFNTNLSFDRGVLLNQTRSDWKLPVIYGTRRVGGWRRVLGSSGEKNKFLYLVLVLGEGPVNAIPNVYLDNINTEDLKYSSTKSENLLFMNSPGWTLGAGWTEHGSTTIGHSPGNTATLTEDSFAPVVGTSYRVIYRISVASAGTITVSCGGQSDDPEGTNGYHVFDFTATTTDGIVITPSSTFNGRCGGRLQFDGLPCIAEVMRRRSLVTITKHLGATDQLADSEANGSSVDLVGNIDYWTTDHRGQGVAYLAIKLEYDRNVFESLPVVTADVEGRTLYDFRDATTVFSSNPWLVAYDYMTNTRYGRGIAAADLDAGATGTWKDEADFCETEEAQQEQVDSYQYAVNCDAQSLDGEFQLKPGGEDGVWDSCIYSSTFIATGDDGHFECRVNGPYSQTLSKDISDAPVRAFCLVTSSNLGKLDPDDTDYSIRITAFGGGNFSVECYDGVTQKGATRTVAEADMKWAEFRIAVESTAVKFYTKELGDSSWTLMASALTAVSTDLYAGWLFYDKLGFVGNLETDKKYPYISNPYIRAVGDKYRCDGLANTEETSRAILANMLTACRGWLVFTGGKWKAKSDRAGTATLAYNEDDIIAGSFRCTLGNKKNQFNRIKAHYFNPSRGYEGDIAVVESTVYRTADNEEVLEHEVKLSYTLSTLRVKRIATIDLAQSRQQIAIEFVGMPKMARLECGDLFKLTHDSMGWVNKIFRVATVRLRYDHEVDIQAVEYDSTVYDVSAIDPDDIDYSPNTNFAEKDIIPGPTGLAIAETTFAVTPNIHNRITVSWTAASSVFIRKYEIGYQESADTEWTVAGFVDVGTNTFLIDDLPAGTYDFRVGSVATSQSDIGYTYLTGETVTGTAGLNTAGAGGTGARVEVDSSGLVVHGSGGQTVDMGTDGSGWVGTSGTKAITWDGSGSVTISGWTATADSFSKNSATLHSDGYLNLGSGDNIARLDAQDATYRLWIGDAVAADAPFKVSKEGVLTATGATITGSITADSLHIPDEDITANSAHIAIDGNTWWGCTSTDFTADNDNANAYILKTGYAKFQDVEIAGTFTMSGVGISTATITGGTIQTASSGARSVLNNSGLAVYDASAQRAKIGSDGAGWLGASGTFSWTSGGVLTAGGFTISSSAISTGAFDTAGTLYFGSSGISLADTFKVTSAGALTCTGATVTGTITATDGQIGGFFINATSIASDATANNAGILIDKANEIIRVGDTGGGYITINGASRRIRSNNYTTGVNGAGFNLDSDWLEVGNIAARGIIRTAVFQKDVISAVGGSVMIRPADVLDSDMTASDSANVTIEGNETFSVGDILRIKDGTDDEWLTVAAGETPPTYNVTRDRDGDYASGSNPAWAKGATVVNYGVSGDGGVYLTSSETNAPYIEVFTHAGSPWDTISSVARLGNLNGYLGYSSDIYGLGVSKDSNNYITVEPTNGIRISCDSANAISILKGGDIYLEPTDNDSDYGVIQFGSSAKMGAAGSSDNSAIWSQSDGNNNFYIGAIPTTSGDGYSASRFNDVVIIADDNVRLESAAIGGTTRNATVDTQIVSSTLSQVVLDSYYSVSTQNASLTVEASSTQRDFSFVLDNNSVLAITTTGAIFDDRVGINDYGISGTSPRCIITDPSYPQLQLKQDGTNYCSFDATASSLDITPVGVTDNAVNIIGNLDINGSQAISSSRVGSFAGINSSSSITASSGNITASSGNIVVSSGTITASGNITSSSGNINASSGNITANGNLRATTGVVEIGASTVINSSAQLVNCSYLGNSIGTAYTDAKCTVTWPNTYSANQNLNTSSDVDFNDVDLAGDLRLATSAMIRLQSSAFPAGYWRIDETSTSVLAIGAVGTTVNASDFGINSFRNVSIEQTAGFQIEDDSSQIQYYFDDNKALFNNLIELKEINSASTPSSGYLRLYTLNNTEESLYIKDSNGDEYELATTEILQVESNIVTSAVGGAQTKGIANDDTIPQNDEGIEIITQAITPKSSTSTLVIRANITYSSGNSGNVVLALFVDSTADAISAVMNSFGSTQQQIGLEFHVTSGSTSARTYKLRLGHTTATTNTFYINGTTGGSRKLGGVSSSILSITEVNS